MSSHWNFRHAFPGQERGEPVFVFLRPYPIAFIPVALIFFVVFAASLAAQYLLSTGFLADFDTTGSFSNAAVATLGVFQLITTVIFMAAVFDFYFDIIIVTDRRLVDIDQDQLFSRRISTLALEDIQDITTQTTGFLQSIFGYHNVLIQTAGAKEKFEVLNIRFPEEVAALILDLSEQAKRNVEVHHRIPEHNVMGVINNQAISTMQELASVGAILPTDPRVQPTP